MSNYKELKTWNLAMDLVVDVYKFAENLPKEETYGLKSQVCRAIASVPSNIAEGSGQRSDKEFVRFLLMAKGSLNEAETQILIIKRIYPSLGINAVLILDKCNTLGAMLHSFISRKQGQRAVGSRNLVSGT